MPPTRSRSLTTLLLSALSGCGAPKETPTLGDTTEPTETGSTADTSPTASSSTGSTGATGATGETGDTGTAGTTTYSGAYTVTDLGVLPGGLSSTATSVDASGMVAGTSQAVATNGPLHAFSWTSATGLVDLGTLGGEYSLGYAVSGGVVVGESDDGYGSFAFLADGTGTYSLGGLSGVGSDAHGINAAGVVVGSARNAATYQRAVRYEGGAVIELGTLIGGDQSNSRALAINDSGRVVGGSDSPSGGEAATAWDGGILTELAPPPSIAVAVNAVGDAVGWTGNFGATRPALYRGGATIDLGLLPDFTSGEAMGINGAGRIVGSNFRQSGEITELHAFVTDGVTLSDLNDLVTTADWTIQRANGISDAGWIAGQGVREDGTTHALLLIPAP
ncbi:MAG: hypothetical protein ABMA64_30855 [Myxococcota bacterium]